MAHGRKRSFLAGMLSGSLLTLFIAALLGAGLWYYLEPNVQLSSEKSAKEITID